uniref:Ferrochelatase n=1 Tax=Schistocephalus solidus TaxID=70667 RepID=A0A183TJV2_SCHSO
LAPWVAKRRTPKLQERYEEIGGGSPLGRWTVCQGKALVRILDTISPESGFYAPKTIFSQSDGVERVVAFSQYPQYSCTVSGSSINSIAVHYSRPERGGLAGIDTIEPPLSLQGSEPSRPIPVWSFLDRWPTAPHAVKFFAEGIRNELARMPDLKDQQEAVVLFSAHSIPMSVVNRGDPYIQEVGATVHAVMQELDFALPYRLVWQSKVGPAAWMGQNTASAIRGLARIGRKHAIIVPITFTSDHIETLHDMDIEFCARIAKEAGMISVRRAAAPNDNAMFVQGLAELVRAHLREGQVASRQFFLRCPSCTNDRCSKARLFLAGETDRLAAWTNAQSFRLPSGAKATYRKVAPSV